MAAPHVIGFSTSSRPPARVGCEYGIKGKRDAMEDASAYARWICRATVVELFGIFDGHGGNEASDLASRVLPVLIASELENPTNGASVRTALIRSFHQMQAYMQAFYPRQLERQGTTAVVVLRIGTTLYCANAGDSRAVMCSGNAINLSQDHKPNQTSEKSRIHRLGGYVNLPSQGTPRVWKSKDDRRIGLSTSRSLGDLESRTESGEYLVSPTPDVSVHEIRPGLLILACDGVWDVMTSAEACRVASADAPNTCKKLVRHAYAKGSTDNISAMIIRL